MYEDQFVLCDLEQWVVWINSDVMMDVKIQ